MGRSRELNQLIRETSRPIRETSIACPGPMPRPVLADSVGGALHERTLAALHPGHTV